MINGNGDSLAPIECSVPIHHPKWNWEGTKITVYRAFGTGAYKSFVFYLMTRMRSLISLQGYIIWVVHGITQSN